MLDSSPIFLPQIQQRDAPKDEQDGAQLAQYDAGVVVLFDDGGHEEREEQRQNEDE